MAGEWRERPLGELTDNFDGIRVPVKETDRRPGPYPYYGASGVVDHVDNYLFDGEYLLIAEDGENLRTRTTPVAFLARGKFWVNNHAHIVRGNREADTRFLMYALSVADISGYLTGSTMPKLTQGNMNRIPLLTPPLPEQRAIAHILGTLDDKIELNRRMSETLEAMARALFKSWFVDFDPVRAKMEGRDPGLPKPLADLFPDSFADSELGEIPKGWEVATLSDHFHAVKGVSYKGSGLGDRGMPLHNLNSIYEGGGYKYEGIKYYSGEYAERHVVLPGDVIVANTEQGHDRLLIGYAALVPSLLGDHGIASHHVYRLRPKPRSPLTAAYLCWLLNSPQVHNVVSGYANGTTVNMLPIDGVQKPAIVCPPKRLVAAFDSVATCAARRQEEMVAESRTLAALRGALLPKLISGELRVKDAERLIGTVA
ncbi:MAG TPA: restriction endonuclease subunit S [Vicinamibacterales bacterium]|nr:restriction endonuclease subunit S [Vicinamibacterales bacterium]